VQQNGEENLSICNNLVPEPLASILSLENKSEPEAGQEPGKKATLAANLNGN